MAILYCTAINISDYVLQAYLAKVEELNPGCIDRHIENVSAEISEALLQAGLTVPAENSSATSATLKRICAVMSAWRAVGDITSLMDTEAVSNNEWLPLQRLNSRCERDLDLIRSGKLDPFPAEQQSSIYVSAPAKMFPHELWSKF